MNGLLSVATVLSGDGHWTIGYEVDALACGRVIESVDICAPGDERVVPDTALSGFRVEPFTVIGDQQFGTRCTPAEAEAALTEAMADASEYMVAKNFWNGDVEDWKGADTGLFLADADIATVAAGASPDLSIAKVIQEAFDNHPEIKPIIHLGLTAAMRLPITKFDELGFTYAVSPGYPTNGIAVTGPVVVRLGSIETLKSYDTSINRVHISGTRLAAVEFDPCLAVRVA